MLNIERMQTGEKPVSQEAIVSSREQFVEKIPTDIKQVIGVCTDGRNADIFNNPNFAHLSGGAAGIAHALDTLAWLKATPEEREALKHKTLASSTAETVDILDAREITMSVHTADTHVHDDQCGCGFIQGNQAINQFIFDNGTEIIDTLKEKMPYIIANEYHEQFALDYVKTAGDFAANDDYYTTGRDVQDSATKRGAPLVIFEGDHGEIDAIINLEPGTSVNNNKANAAGLSAFGLDMPYVEDVFKALSDQFPYDSQEVKIAVLITNIAVWNFLGVDRDHIAVREGNQAA